MSGFDKDSVVQSIEKSIEAQKAYDLARHEEMLKSHKESVADARDAGKKLVAYARKLVDGKVEPRDFFVKVTKSTYRSSNEFVDVQFNADEPVFEPSANLKSLEKALCIAKGFSGTEFSVTQLDKLGLLRLVKV